jgi:hypothetical protein
MVLAEGTGSVLNVVVAPGALEYDRISRQKFVDRKSPE